MSSLSPPRSLVTTNTTAANRLATFHPRNHSMPPRIQCSRMVE